LDGSCGTCHAVTIVVEAAISGDGAGRAQPAAAAAAKKTAVLHLRVTREILARVSREAPVNPKIYIARRRDCDFGPIPSTVC
jgi:hypothetical protein